MKRHSQRAPELICLVSFLIFFAVFFPGLMSKDSFNQLGQSMTGVYDDWHPPLMAWFWGVVSLGHPHPAPLFIVQLGSFWLALSFIGLSLRGRYGPSKKLLLIPLVGWVPAVFSMNVVLWKDVQLVSALLLCFALLIRENAEPLRDSPWKRTGLAGLAILLLFYGSGVRINGLAAIPPFCLFMAWQWGLDHRPRWSYFKSGWISLLLLILIFLAQRQATQSLAPVSSFPIQYLYQFDITKISCDSGRNFFPDWVTQQNDFQMSLICARYHPDSGDDLFYGDDGRALLRLTRDPEQVHQLRQAWVKAVTQEPQIWFRHRTAVFASLLRIDEEEGYYTYQGSMDFNTFGYKTSDNPIQANFVHFLDKTKSWLIFKPWIYLLFSLVGLGWGGIRHRSLDQFRWGSMLLWSSGVLYILPQWFIVPASDFRYAHWLVVSCLMGWALIGATLHPQIQNAQEKAR